MTRALNHPQQLAAPAPAAEHQHRGGVIGGRYEVLAQVEEAHDGVLYLCQDDQGETVALKLFIDDLCTDRDAIAEFGRDFRALRRVEHPNLARLLDVVEEGDRVGVVLENVAGVPLAGLVERHGPLPLARAGNYIVQAARGLLHAHAAGWFHRDVRPEYLLLDEAGTVRVRYLGVQQFLTENGTLPPDATTSPLFGRGDYLAPERVEDYTRGDDRADVYGLGATFYFLLTGRGPFAAEPTVAARFRAHLSAAPTPPKEVCPDLPDAVAALIEQMLSKQPNGRPSLADLVEELWTWGECAPRPIENSGTRDDGDEPGEDGLVHSDFVVPSDLLAAGRAQRESRAPTPATEATSPGIAAHAGRVLSVCFSGDDRYVATGGSDATVRLFRVEDALVECGTLADATLGDVSTVVFVPGQTCLVTGSTAPTAVMWRWRFSERQGQQTQPIPEVSACCDALGFSPDGRVLASALASQVVLWGSTPDGFAQRSVLQTTHGDVKALAFSPDGKMLATASAGAIQLWKKSWFHGWAGSTPLVGHPDGVATLAFSPRGDVLASAGERDAIHLWDVESRTLAASYFDLGAPAVSMRFVGDDSRLLVALADGRIHLYDPSQETPVQEWVLAVDLSGAHGKIQLGNTGKLVVVGQADGQVHLFHLPDAE